LDDKGNVRHAPYMLRFASSYCFFSAPASKAQQTTDIKMTVRTTMFGFTATEQPTHQLGDLFDSK
jgi:hypothetical protein